ncbi:hypothetical protein [Persephonella sp.]|uniref:hypothetical protein n=1 Tax=Persephonella sp. TaxID=2060922 RepID=UPI0026247020|nr:hypothetical protein [Persephonella sp.]
MGKRKKNPFTIILILTGLMFLPFLAFLFDKFLQRLGYSTLFFAELGIISMGLGSGFLIYYFFFRN